MEKDQAYHESAIAYNEGLAEFAENLAPTLRHEEVRRWCVAVGKQHRFHAKRHRSALNKFLLKQKSAPVEALSDGLDVPSLPLGTLTATGTVISASSTSTDNSNVSVETTVTEVEAIVELQPNTLDDGCIEYHNPSTPTCQFYPKDNTNG